MVLLHPIHHWHCRACDLRDVTNNAGPHTQFHNCPAMNGVSLPMVEVKSDDRKADARYVPNMADHGLASVSTEHGSGRVDCTVFPQTAEIISRSHI